MSKALDANAKSPEFWGELIAYLSMDITDPFWPALGFLPDLPMDAVRQDLRQSIKGFRETVAEDPSGFHDIREYFFNETSPGFLRSIRDQLLQLGLKNYVSDHSEAPQKSAWDIALSYFPAEFPLTRDLLVNEGGEAIIETVIQKRDAFDAPITVPELLSVWDMQMCARHGWNPKDELGFPPIDAQENAVSLKSTLDALSYFSETASLPAQKCLFSEASHLVDRFEVWMPEPLQPLCIRVDDAVH